MVRAILDGRKTQTRRVINPQPAGPFLGLLQRPVGGNPLALRAWFGGADTSHEVTCPYGQSGDKLWVRETIAVNPMVWAETHGPQGAEYPASTPRDQIEDDKLVPSIHMPRWASRITLEIVSVRVERLQDISEDDVKSEGCEYLAYRCAEEMDPNDPKEFSDLWDMINMKRGHSWASNPWVWCLTFKRVEP